MEIKTFDEISELYGRAIEIENRGDTDHPDRTFENGVCETIEWLCESFPGFEPKEDIEKSKLFTGE